MASIISASTTSATALNLSGDTTGILQLATGTTPTTAITIDASQNVGIGTSSPSRKLEVSGSSTSNIDAFVTNTQSTTTGAITSTGTSYSYSGVGGSTSWFYGSKGVALGNDTNYPLQFITNGAERMRIDSSGSVGIGTTTPVAQIGIYGAGQTTAAMSTSSNLGGTLYLRDSGGAAGNGGAIIFGANQGAFTAIKGLITDGATNTAGVLAFSTRNSAADSTLTERMRIDASGNVLVGTTTASGRFTSTSATTTSTPITANSPASFVTGNYISNSITAAGTGWFHFYATSSSGTIQNCIIYGNGNIQNTNNSYGALSDAKLKTNVINSDSQWNDVKALGQIVKKYTLISDETQTPHLGFIAQEVQTISPKLVYSTQDRDAEGNVLKTETLGVSYSLAYMKAFKALGEALIRIETLETQVTALNAKVGI
jgi:Chaperone of endosialidase